MRTTIVLVMALSLTPVSTTIGQGLLWQDSLDHGSVSVGSRHRTMRLDLLSAAGLFGYLAGDFEKHTLFPVKSGYGADYKISVAHKPIACSPRTTPSDREVLRRVAYSLPQE